ncbi:hypothetical protein ACS79Z_12155 [Yersinia enterocolitica]|uniref:hypothetical protein n=1 Tax=Yersinia enterocolitica TaxID=630 RepID=UPI003F481527
MKIMKYTEGRGRPWLSVPSDHLDYCDKHKFPAIVVWVRKTKADVSWFNEPYQLSHQWVFSRQDFQRDIERRGEEIYLKYATPKTARAIQYSMMTLYDLTITDARKAAGELFDMTLEIIKEYETKKAKVFI